MTTETRARIRQYGPESWDEVAVMDQMLLEAVQRCLVSGNIDELIYWRKELDRLSSFLLRRLMLRREEIRRRMYDPIPTITTYEQACELFGKGFISREAFKPIGSSVLQLGEPCPPNTKPQP